MADNASKLAMLGGDPVCSTPPKVEYPRFDEREERGLIEVLRSRQWGGFPSPSPKAEEFSRRFAAHHGAAHGVCATNGSVTLEVALNALGVEAGDEIIVPTYTWIATGACAIHVNAVPVFVDVDPDNYCMDPAEVEAAITPKTRGIIPVHLGANMADMDRLREIAAKHDLFIIEDCAHAHGAKWRGAGAGSMGDIGSFSFQRSKLMTAGEGGALITSDDDLIQKMHSVINCGRKEPGYDDFEERLLGVNARMTDFQAAILLAQLDRLDADTKTREDAVAYLTDELAHVGGLTPLARDKRITTRAAYQLIMKYDPDAFAGVHRNVFLQALEAEGIEADGPFYVPMHEHPLFNARSAQWPQLRERYGDGIQSPETLKALDFPVASKAAYHEAVWLHYPYLMAGTDALDRIVEAVAKIKANAHALA